MDIGHHTVQSLRSGRERKREGRVGDLAIADVPYTGLIYRATSIRTFSFTDG